MGIACRSVLRSAACIFFVIALSGCVAFPPMAPKPVGNEHYLTCLQLDNSFNEAQGFLKRAEEEDRFRLSYLFPPSGMLSVWNIMRAKSRANERMSYIQQVKQQKNCPQSLTAPGAQSQGRGYGYQQQPQIYPQNGGYGAPQQYGYPRR